MIGVSYSDLKGQKDLEDDVFLYFEHCIKYHKYQKSPKAVCAYWMQNTTFNMNM